MNRTDAVMVVCGVPTVLGMGIGFVLAATTDILGIFFMCAGIGLGLSLVALSVLGCIGAIKSLLKNKEA